MLTEGILERTERALDGPAVSMAINPEHTKPDGISLKALSS